MPLQEPACVTAETNVVKGGSLSLRITSDAPAEPRLVTETVKLTLLPTGALAGCTVCVTAMSGAGSACHDGTVSLVGAKATRAGNVPLAVAIQRSLPRRNAIQLPSGENDGRMVADTARNELCLPVAVRPHRPDGIRARTVRDVCEGRAVARPRGLPIVAGIPRQAAQARPVWRSR